MMKQEMTMGSLFSGSGGFELAADIFGIKPLWASEVEPFPILVTKKNFPEMEHLGDINYLKGNEADPVTVIAGGSPCQDMSIAGKREGLGGSRSNLFREQIRVIKEMREHDRKSGRTGKYIRPRFMVWENVPGAFSSNKGDDFRCVLEETARIADPTANVPPAPKGRWGGAGSIMGDGYSIAWRTLDAQYWGVPQRRKRIFLVADFGGDTAPKILFKREGLSRNFEASREARQRAAGGTADSADEAGAADDRSSAGFILKPSPGAHTIGYKEEQSPTLIAGKQQGVIVLENHPQDCRVTIADDNVSPTLTGKMGTGGGNVPMIMSKTDAGGVSRQ